MPEFPGYRAPSNEKIRAVTEAKMMEERTIRWIESADLDLSFDPRWKAIALTHLQEGYMALVRAILNPERISLPEDRKATSAQTAEPSPSGAEP